MSIENVGYPHPSEGGTHCRECGVLIGPDMVCEAPMYCPGFLASKLEPKKKKIELKVEHDMSNRDKGGYEIWTENTVVSVSWQTVQGAQKCLDGLKRVFLTPLEIFYVHRIPTADEKEAFHVTKTGRDPARGTLLRSQMLGEDDARRVRQGLDSDAGAGSQTVARLREALARSTEDNTKLRRYIHELEEELGREHK